jgi:hypothetical protein
MKMTDLEKAKMVIKLAAKTYEDGKTKSGRDFTQAMHDQAMPLIKRVCGEAGMDDVENEFKAALADYIMDKIEAMMGKDGGTAGLSGLSGSGIDDIVDVELAEAKTVPEGADNLRLRDFAKVVIPGERFWVKIIDIIHTKCKGSLPSYIGEVSNDIINPESGIKRYDIIRFEPKNIFEINKSKSVAGLSDYTGSPNDEFIDDGMFKDVTTLTGLSDNVQQGIRKWFLERYSDGDSSISPTKMPAYRSWLDRFEKGSDYAVQLMDDEGKRIWHELEAGV